MKLRRRNKTEPKQVRLEKKEKKPKKDINYKKINVILLTILIFLICFVVIPLLIYQTGTLESTNYYYRMGTMAMIIPILL